MAIETNSKEPGSYTQVKAQQDIVSWSVDRPDWQRDALRQLINGVDVDEIDLDRLEALCVRERKDFQFPSCPSSGFLGPMAA